MNRKTCLVLTALALPLLLACSLTLFGGCIGPEENCAESYDDRRTNLARICTDKEIYDFAAPVYITFTVTNISDQPLTLNGGDEPAMDIYIYVAGEYWSDGRELTPELTRVTLEPGESHILTWVWPTPRTDLKPFERMPRIGGPLGIRIHGVVRPFPGTRGAVLLDAEYRWP